MTRHTFQKSERMVSLRDIEQLFSSGSHSFAVFPLRVIYREVTEDDPALQVLISVSKRHLRHAIDRNRAKRQIREAYRHNKESIIAPLLQKGKYLHLAFVWLSDKPESSAQVQASLVQLLQIIKNKL